MQTEHTVPLESADGRVHDDVAKGLEAGPRYTLIVCDVDLAAKALVNARISHLRVAWAFTVAIGGKNRVPLRDLPHEG